MTTADPAPARRITVTAARPADRVIEEWVTIAVTPLAAGWRNVFTTSDGERITAAAPALLTQELRVIERIWDAPATAVDERVMQPPYDTRIVFADHSDGEVGPAVELGNYVGTIGPGDQAPAVR